MALVAHFVVTLLYLHPISVLGLATHSYTVQYMEPLFRQRWTLFAPDPPLANRWVDYQCVVGGETQPWVSRTHALVDAHARVRFSPADRMRRYEQAAVMAIVGVKNSVIDELVAKKDQVDQAQRERLELRVAHDTVERILGSRKLYELVTHYCNEDHGKEPEQVRFRLVTEPIAPYSQRHDQDWVPKQQVFTSAWIEPGNFDDLQHQAEEFMRGYWREHGQTMETAP